MAIVPFSAFTALGGAPAVGDLLALTDVSDHTQSADGSTKSLTVANLFTAPTISAPTVTGGMSISGAVTTDDSLTVGDQITGGASVVATLDLVAGGGAAIVFSGRSQFLSPADGIVTLLNNVGGALTQLAFGVTSSDPSFVNDGTGVLVKRADGTAYTSLRALSLITDSLNFSNYSGTAKTIGGTSGISLRNNADTADNLLVTDAGAVTVRALTTTSTLDVTGVATLHAGAVYGASTGTAATLDSGSVAMTGSAVTISNTSEPSAAAIALVRGSNGTDAFADVVVYGGNVAAPPLSQLTITGTPAARSYTSVFGVLKCALASGYNVACVDVRGITNQ